MPSAVESIFIRCCVRGTDFHFLSDFLGLIRVILLDVGVQEDVVCQHARLQVCVNHSLQNLLGLGHFPLVDVPFQKNVVSRCRGHGVRFDHSLHHSLSVV